MLKGKFVGLRSVEINDLSRLLEWRNTTQLRRYFREFRELSMANQRLWYKTVTSKNSSSIMFSIIDLESKQILGACGLCQINWVNKSSDFSIYIGKDNLYIDEKFAPDAAQILISYTFNELGLNRLWGEVYCFDGAKSKLFERLGFILEGRLRQTQWSEMRWHDSLIYGLIKDDLNRGVSI